MTLGIRLPNWLGDALLARSALDSLVGAYGADGVLLAAPRRVAELLRAHYPRTAWIETAPGLSAALALARAWRRAGVERAVLFPPSLASRLAAAQSGARVRVGLGPRPRRPREREAGVWLTRAVPRGPRGSRHLEDEYLDLAAAAGGVPAPRRLLAVEPAARSRAAALLGRAGTGPYMVVAPGARYGPAKRWPAERFATAARTVAAALGDPAVVLVGDDADRDACARVAAALGPAALDLAGRTDLAALAGVLAGAAGVLANDSGAAHLAAALGRPTAVIFGSTDPRWTAPRGPGVGTFWHRLRCAPCFRRACPWVDAYACLRVVEPREVAAGLISLVAGAGP